MIKVKNTKEIKRDGGHFFLLYSKSKSGKTTALNTLEGRTFIIDTDDGIVSLSGSDNIEYVTVNESTNNAIKEIKEALDYVEKNIDKYDNICLDTLTQLSKMMLDIFMVGKKDGRQAYGELNTALYPIVRKLERFARRDGKNVVVTTQLEATTGQDEKEVLAPSIDGKTLLNKVLLPRFDAIVYLDVDNLGKRWFVTKANDKLLVGIRDPKNSLKPRELANFSEVFAKLK